MTSPQERANRARTLLAQVQAEVVALSKDGFEVSIRVKPDYSIRLDVTKQQVVRL